MSFTPQEQHDVSLLLQHSEAGDASKPKKDEEAAHGDAGTDLAGLNNQQLARGKAGKYKGKNQSKTKKIGTTKKKN